MLHIVIVICVCLALDVRRKTIYEYHRVELLKTKITSSTTVEMMPLPSKAMDTHNIHAHTNCLANRTIEKLCDVPNRGLFCCTTLSAMSDFILEFLWKLYLYLYFLSYMEIQFLVLLAFCSTRDWFCADAFSVLFLFRSMSSIHKLHFLHSITD